MKRGLLAIFILVVLVTGLIIGVALAQSEYNGARWEYLFVAHTGLETSNAFRPTMPSNVVFNGEVIEVGGIYYWDFFNELGDEGWELVSGDITNYYLLFKRKAE